MIDSSEIDHVTSHNVAYVRASRVVKRGNHERHTVLTSVVCTSSANEHSESGCRFDRRGRRRARETARRKGRRRRKEGRGARGAQREAGGGGAGRVHCDVVRAADPNGDAPSRRVATIQSPPRPPPFDATRRRIVAAARAASATRGPTEPARGNLVAGRDGATRRRPAGYLLSYDSLSRNITHDANETTTVWRPPARRDAVSLSLSFLSRRATAHDARATHTHTHDTRHTTRRLEEP